MEKSEFEQMVRILESFADNHSQHYMHPTMYKFQLHMVAHLEDTAHLEKKDIKQCPEFPFALLCQLCWSKNVREERDALDQLLLGPMALFTVFCLLLPFFLNYGLGLEKGS
jgi:hypothetical protein